MEKTALRRMTVVPLSAACVLVAGHLSLLGRPLAVFPHDLSFERRWVRPTPKADRPAMLVAGSSVSGSVLKRQTLAKSLERSVKPVWNDAGNGFHLADAWATLLAQDVPQADVHLIEINQFFFNERRWLWGRHRQEYVRVAEHGLALLEVTSGRLRYEIIAQLGLNPIVAAWVRRHFRPVHFSACNDSLLRIRLRGLLLTAQGKGQAGRPDRAERLTKRKPEIIKKNFSGKQYHDGPDSLVLEELLSWITRQQNPQAYVIYFPPLNVEWIRETAGPEALVRLRRWTADLRATCKGLGVPSCDMTDALVGQNAFVENDYGHLRKDRFDGLAQRILADLALNAAEERPH